MAFTYEWRGDFDNAAVSALHAECFDHPVLEDDDWKSQVERHSLGWVCAREGDELVGLVNVAWDWRDPRLRARHHGPAGARRQGVGTGLVAVAVKEARAAGCEWLHVDFEDHPRASYLGACGFVPTTPDSSPEAAFAVLAGVNPIPASSGQVTRHRLNRSGDRRLNRAPHTSVVARLRDDPQTRACAARRRAEGRSARDIRRCFKRAAARQLFKPLERATTGLWSRSSEPSNDVATVWRSR